jgi:hypothetical protein
MSVKFSIHSRKIFFAVSLSSLFVIVSFIALAGTVPLAYAASSGGHSLPTSSLSPNSKGVTTICSPKSQGGYTPTGLFSVQNGAVFAVDANTGDLLWCNAGNTFLVATPPSGGATNGYYGLAGVSTSIGVVLAMITGGGGIGTPGLWLCFGLTLNNCSVESTFITLPASFCTSQPIGICFPDQLAIDKHLNIYYTDASNGDVVECLYNYNYQNCAVLYNLAPAQPYGIFLDSKGNFWVSDYSCAGDVWENGVLQYSLSDQVSALTLSSSNPSKTQHVYLGITGNCGFYPKADIFDVNDDHFLATPVTSGTFIYSITSRLQFTDGNKIYSVKDTT